MVQRMEVVAWDPAQQAHPVAQPEALGAWPEAALGTRSAQKHQLSRNPVPSHRQMVGPENQIEVLVRFVVGHDQHQG